MFSVVYEFDVITGKENDFKRLWNDITLEVKKHDNGLGSRLHKVVGKKNKWVAYAQWSSREDWLNQAPLTLKTNRAELIKKMKETTCIAITTLLELEVVDDLLEPYSEL